MRLERARYLWALLFCGATVLAGAAVASSEGFVNIPTDNPSTTTTPSPVAVYLASTNVVSEAMQRSMVLLASTPPKSKVFSSDRAIAVDLRSSTYDGAWSNVWLSESSDAALDVTYYDFTHPQFATGQDSSCHPTHQTEVKGWAGEAGFGLDPYGDIAGCADLRREDQRLLVHVMFKSEKLDQADREARLTAVIAAQTRALPQPTTAEMQLARVPTPAGRATILRTWMFALVGLGLLVTLPPAIRDRTWRQRLANVGRRRRGPQTVDLSSAAYLARWRARALGMFHFAALAWLMRGAEVAPLSGFSTGALIIVAHVVLTWARGWLERRWLPSGRVRLLRGTSAAIVVAGGLAALVLMALAALVWNFGMTMSTVVAAADLADWNVRRTGVLVQLLAFGLLAFGALVPLTFARRIAMSRVRWAAVPDPRVAALLLRSFSDDRITVRGRSQGRSGLLDRLAFDSRDRFEEVLAATIHMYGPVLAVATPGERLAPALGAVRRQFADDEWQEAVHRLADEAPFVVLVVGRSEGTVWEMRRLVESGLTHKTVLVLPPVSRKEAERRLTLISEIFAIPWSVLDPSGTKRNTLAVTMPLASSASVFVADGADDLAYSLALASAITSLEPTTELVRDDAAVASERGRPAAEVIPAGHYRPVNWWKKSRVLVMSQVLSIAVIPVLGFVWFGSASFTDDATSVGYPDGVGIPDQLLGGTSDLVYARWGRQVVSVNLEQGLDSLTVLAELPEQTSEALRRGTDLFWVARDEGLVGRTDLTTGRTQWSVDVGQGIRGLSADDDVVVVASPASQEVVMLEPGGEIRGTTSIAGTPWDTAVADRRVAVALPDRSRVDRIDVRTAHLLDPVPLDSPAVEVEAYGKGWLAIENGQRTATILREMGSVQIHRTDPYGGFAVSGDRLALGGYERVSVFSGSKVWRFRTEPGTVLVGLLEDGGLILADSGGITARTNASASR